MSLNLNNVAASYGKGLALHDVTMEIGDKEIVALIGANGAGKSTVLRSISGLVNVVGGEIVFDGQPIHRRTPRIRGSLLWAGRRFGNSRTHRRPR